MQDEVKRLRADPVRPSINSVRLRPGTGSFRLSCLIRTTGEQVPGTNVCPIRAGSFRPPCLVCANKEQISGTVFPPCHIRTAREQVPGTVFPPCLVCADKEQVSGDEKEKLDGQ